MKYTLYARHHQLIHILRQLIHLNNGVIGRNWQVSGEGLGRWVTVEGAQVYLRMFPEFPESAHEVTLSGERLIERAAIISHLESNDISRFSTVDPQAFDLIIRSADLGAAISVETDDDEVVDALYDFFELTSSDSHAKCFC